MFPDIILGDGEWRTEIQAPTTVSTRRSPHLYLTTPKVKYHHCQPNVIVAQNLLSIFSVNYSMLFFAAFQIEYI